MKQLKAEEADRASKKAKADAAAAAEEGGEEKSE